MRRTMPRVRSQAGGITILVALMLLVLLTIAGVGMSRNAFREVVISGTARQGAMVRNTADAGLEWAICWLDMGNAPAASGTAASMQTLKGTLLADDSKAGRAYDVLSRALYAGPWDAGQADLKYTAGTGATTTTQWMSMALTRMGKLPIADTSQGNLQGAFSPARGGTPTQAPDLWALRSDAQLKVGTGLFAPVFVHSKEAWISTPVQ